MISTENRRMGWIAALVLGLDQLTKLIVLRVLGPTQERVVVPGFFRFVHWENSGAAFSQFHDRNGLLAGVSAMALVGLYLWRRHFYSHLPPGRIALGLIFGGIAGNLCDRLHNHQVIDFLRFYLIRHSGQEIGFPAFNVADSAICVGVGLLILVSWKYEKAADDDGEKVRAPVQTGFRADQ